VKVFLIGARGSGLGALARALTHPPRSRFLTDRGILSTLDRLWHATEARVRRPGTPWARPEPPDWVDGAVADFGRLLIKQHAEGAAIVGIAEPEAPTERLGRWFPNAMVLHLVRDGLEAPITPPSDPHAAARAGLDWAERWASCATTGEGASVLRFEAIADLLPQLGQAMGLPGVGVWQPRPRQRLVGPAAEGFACCAPAVARMAALGYPVPEPGPLSLAVPRLAAARARGLIAAGQCEAALALLEGAGGEHPVLLDVIGEALLTGGDEDGAAAAWVAALRHPDAPRTAWLSLLSLSARRESASVARHARLSPDPVIRGAAARWMVDRGMDREAAEAVAQVHGERWYLR
jgi:hypothetical protein